MMNYAYMSFQLTVLLSFYEITLHFTCNKNCPTSCEIFVTFTLLHNVAINNFFLKPALHNIFSGFI